MDLRELLAQFTARIESQVSAQIEAAVERGTSVARAAARRELAEELNQGARRLRQCAGADEVLAVLAAICAPFCGRAAIFTVAEGVVKGMWVAGLEPPDAVERFCAMEFPLESAGAFQTVVESRDPVVAAATGPEIGEGNVALFAHPADDRVYLFPVMTRQNVRAVLYAAGGSRGVEVAPLELLSGVASAVLDALTPAGQAAGHQEAAPELVTIRPATVEADVKVPQWASLTAAEEEAHLRAQRLARVLVAEIRLYRPDAVRSGRARGDLYGLLREPIDQAREKFRQACFRACPSMVDYLHLEMVRSLANDDVRLLGSSYPGPLRREGNI